MAENTGHNEGKQAFWKRGLFIFLSGIVQVVTLPAQVLRAIFYVPVQVSGEDGQVDIQRGFFSITRALFVFGAIVGIYRLIAGGTEVQSLELGPSVDNALLDVKHVNNITMSKTGKISNRDSSKRGKQPTTGNTALRRGRKKIRCSPSTGKQKKVWFRLQGYKSIPMQTNELLFILMLGCFYFFRKHLQKGDTTGEDSWFSKIASAGLASKGYILQPIGTPGIESNSAQAVESPLASGGNVLQAGTQSQSVIQNQPVATQEEPQVPRAERGIG